MKLKFALLLPAFIAIFLSASAVAENSDSSGSNASASPIASEAKAIKYKADKGDADAQYRLGVMHYLGNGVPKDVTKSVEWFQKAATQGHVQAQTMLAVAFDNGEGVAKDSAKAFEWYQKAAAQGDAVAQYSLGVMYDRGDGVPKDATKAVEWYLKAAAQGVVYAQSNLALIYAKGNGVSVDIVRAYVWSILAATQGDEKAKKVRDIIETDISSAQRTEGQRLASKWKIGDTLQTSSNTADAQTPTNRATENNDPPQKKTSDTIRWKSAGNDSYIDTNSIQIVDGLTYVWLKKNGTNDQKNDYKLTRWVINCSNHTIDVISSISIDSSGKSSSNFDHEPAKWKFMSAPPGSFGDSVINTVCSAISNPTPSSVPAKNESENNASPKLSSTGSGFVVSASGHLLTNHHVVNGCTNLKIRDSSKIEHDVTIVATDAKNDLALLKTSADTSLPAATFRANGSVESGENVVALGYPLAGVLASEVNVSFGYVSATAGLADDTSKLQISAPVQPGNSGGPLLDQAGNLIGVVVAKLDAIKVAKAIGDIPQNINFAVKGEVTQVFLKAHKVKFKTATASKKLENTDIASRGRAFTVLVECYK